MRAHLNRVARAIALVSGAAWIGAAITSVNGCGSSGAGGGSTGTDGTTTGAVGGSSAGGAGATTTGAATTTTATSGTGGAGPIGDPIGVEAVKASAFLGTLGVCAHVAQGVDAPKESAAAMAYAGILNLRDDGNPNTVPAWISMHKQAGIRTNMLPAGDISTTIDMAKQLQAEGALLAVEGPNEPNNFAVTYEGQKSDYNGSFVPVAHFQRDLYAAVHAEPSLAGVPVFHTSEAGGSEPDNVGLQFLTIPAGAGATMPDGTKYADFANTHNYVCGHQGNLVDNVCWKATDPTLNDDWDGMHVEYGHTWHKGYDGYSDADLVTVPKVSTETGWLTQGNGSITEEQQGRVFLNLYLAGFKHGWAYTFIYMLRDDPVQGYWGLFDTAYQPKKSGEYLHNLTTILADGGPGATGKLDYSLIDNSGTVHDLLLQKTDGTFELVLWDERVGGSTDSPTVSLAKIRKSVKVYDPTTGTAPVQTLSDVVTVMLTLSDHPQILEIAPQF
jgi:hypothetical protein